MIEFKPLTIEARGYIEPFFKSSSNRLADLNFTNLFMWSHSFRPSWTVIGDIPVIRMDFDDVPSFSFLYDDIAVTPIILRRLEEVASACGARLTLRAVSEERLKYFTESFPNMFDISIREDYSDYIYSAESLATLASKKLHSKRNHINRFESSAPWRTELISAQNLGECRAFADEWFHTAETERGGDFTSEKTAMSRLFDNFEKLSTVGMLLYQSNRLVAFTFGEVLSRDTFLTHFEKARSDVAGAYPMINRQFARFITETYPQIMYINREEDLGIEGLRRAKQSYHPAMMGKKYTLTLKDGASLL